MLPPPPPPPPIAPLLCIELDMLAAETLCIEWVASLAAN